MAVLQEYKCPCCGGAISFDTELQKLKCPYCDTEFEVETLKGYDEILRGSEGGDDIRWDSGANEWKDGETEGMRIYVCKSCGGEIVGDDSLAATSCPFCDNPVVLMGQFRGDLKPDYIIPFKLDKKHAKEAFARHLEGKKLLPKAFKTENRLDSIKGVYVPYWLFDSDVSASIRYRATRVTHWADSSYSYTKTSFYSVLRSGDISFEKVPVDGSDKIENDVSESVEPYTYSDLTDFQTAYLAGFIADRYNVESDDCRPRANERIKKSTEKAFAQTVSGYASVTPEQSSVSTVKGSMKYALFPMWLMTTKWNGNTYLFAMNGQTGKFVGNLPCDKSEKNKRFFRAFLIGTAVAFGILVLLRLLGIL
ncbi:MAG: hypothetical protein ILO42_05660 [Clostridia bacterium]|nr:hypothetical protein [Clostridia bacterium]